MIDCYITPLEIVWFARIFRHWRPSDDTLGLVLKVLGKLGTLLSQTLPAKSLHQVETEPVFPDIHCNVLSPLLPSQGDRLEFKSIEEAVMFLQEIDDPGISEYYRERAGQDPLKTLIMERVLEKNGGVTDTFETLPGSIRIYGVWHAKA